MKTKYRYYFIDANTRIVMVSNNEEEMMRASYYEEFIIVDTETGKRLYDGKLQDLDEAEFNG